MMDILVALLLILGTAFTFVAALGVLRLPDVFLRVSASAKSSTLGVGSILLGTALHFSDAGVTSRSIAIILFLLLTTPVAGHMIGRAAYIVGTPLWEGTIIDQLKGRYRGGAGQKEGPDAPDAGAE
jgi:multicomponent Na+:H+ antiporter subunit G